MNRTAQTTGGTSVMTERLAQLHARIRENTSGTPATYIPELAKVDPELFGIAAATVDGAVYSTGDAAHPFTIQSISKAFTYALALDELGPEEVGRRIGVEPSGDAFNSIVMDERHNRPLNPMVNAGAIACTSLVPGTGLEERRARLLDTFSRWAGRPLGVDWAVFESERSTGHRNRAIAFLELNSGMIAEPIDEHLDLYFTQCSILVAATDLAVMAATLANGGVNPMTGERVARREHVKYVLTVMATCGMYDWSGNWLYRVGLPAKSGVGGGILAVLPGQFGVGTFSPPLDDIGNSCRGVDVCEAFAAGFGLHMFDVNPASASVIRRRYDAAVVPSKRSRPAGERAVLAERGRTIGVYELQGVLFFGAAEQLVRQVEQRDPAVRHVIIDGRRLSAADPGALNLVGRMIDSIEAAGGSLTIAGCAQSLRASILDALPALSETVFDDDADAALERAEDAVLAASAALTDRSPVLTAAEVDILGELDADDLARLEPYLASARYSPGETIISENDPADRLYFLTSGSATARLALSDNGHSRFKRLHSFGAGVAFGETALYEGRRRTADVVADTTVTSLELSVANLERLAAEHPGLHARILLGAGRNLAEMLQRAAEQIRALED